MAHLWVAAAAAAGGALRGGECVCNIRGPAALLLSPGKTLWLAEEGQCSGCKLRLPRSLRWSLLGVVGGITGVCPLGV